MLREEGKGRKKERSGATAPFKDISRPHRVTPHSLARTASLHIPSSCNPVGTQGRGLGTRHDSSPPLGSSSHESGSYGCGPFRVTFVVCVNGFHLGQVLLGFPHWIGKPPPLYQVLQLTSYPPAIQNFLHLPFLLSLDDHWKWWWHHLAGQRVLSCCMQERNWECSVFLDCCRYIQLLGIGPYGSDDAIQSVVFIFQLPARACSSPVSSVNPTKSPGWKAGAGMRWRSAPSAYRIWAYRISALATSWMRFSHSAAV